MSTPSAEPRRPPLDPSASRPSFTALEVRTPARLAVGRTGPRLPWNVRATTLAADASAHDAARNEVPRGVVSRLGLTELSTRAHTRVESLRHPTRARQLDPAARARLRRCRQRPDVQLVLCDGLAPDAVARQAPALLGELARRARAGRWRLGTALFVRNARATVHREIARALRPRAIVLITGQRPTAWATHALTAHLVVGTHSAITIRGIGPGGVPARRAARRLVDTVTATLGNTAPKQRSPRPARRKR